MRLGATEQAARLLAIVFALAVVVAMVRVARRGDFGWFAAMLMVGVLASPILWSHYLVLLFVPLAIARPTVDALWLLTAAFYLSPIEPPPSDLQVILVLLTSAVVAVRAVRHPAFNQLPATDIASVEQRAQLEPIAHSTLV
jgi:hypothetical protein